jgi:hypothetical protein
LAAVKMRLTIGAKLSAAATNAVLTKEGRGGQDESKAAGTASAATGAASGSPAAPAVDVSGLSMGGKVAFGIPIAAGLCVAVYFLRKAIVHEFYGRLSYSHGIRTVATACDGSCEPRLRYLFNSCSSK